MQYQSEYSHDQENDDSDSSNEDEEDCEWSSNENSSSKSLSTTSSPISPKNYSPPVRKREFTKSPNASLKNNRSETSPQSSARKKSSHKEKDEKHESINAYLLIALSLFVFVVAYFVFPQVLSIFASNTSNNSTPNRENILKHVENEIRVLKKEFRNQEKKIWSEIYSGIIEVINNPTRPSIFVLFADRNDLMSCLALTIAEVGRMAFGTEESLKVKPTQLDNDTGDVITKLRSVIPQRKSVVSKHFFL